MYPIIKYLLNYHSNFLFTEINSITYFYIKFLYYILYRNTQVAICDLCARFS